MIKAQYFGHSAFSFTHGGSTILIDPFIGDNPLSKVDPNSIKADHILLTHGHGDHLGDTIAIAKKNDATVAATFELATWCANQGVKKTLTMNLGGAWKFPFGRAKLTLAHHSSSTPDGTYVGDAAGIILELDGKTIYHAGDTALFLDMKLIGEMHDIDLALLPIGDCFTMGVDDAIRALGYLKPKSVIPIHFNTFPLIEVDAQAFVNKAKKSGCNARLIQPDETFDI